MPQRPLHPAAPSPKVRRLFDVARIALRAAQKLLPLHAHRFAPKKFTQPQLAACLVLKLWLKQDYRGICALLDQMPELRQALGLACVPHYSTLDRFALSPAMDIALLERLLAEVARHGPAPKPDDKGGGEPPAKKPVALARDSTGLGTSPRSAHFGWRSGKGGQRSYMKLTLAVETQSLVVWAAVAAPGPSTDIMQARRALELAAQVNSAQVEVRDIYADRAYDAEWVHELCARKLSARSWIPPLNVRKDGSVGGQGRRASLAGLATRGYGRRWSVEAAFSGMKRTLGAAILARRADSRQREALLRALTWSIHRRRARQTNSASQQSSETPALPEKAIKGTAMRGLRQTASSPPPTASAQPQAIGQMPPFEPQPTYR